MRCPRCHTQQYSLTAVCPNCDFSADADRLEQYSNLQFLLDESHKWTRLPAEFLADLQAEYGRKLRTVEVELGVRQAPPTIDETRELKRELAQATSLLDHLIVWNNKGWLAQDDWDVLRGETAVTISNIEDRLIDAPTLADPIKKTTETRLQQLRYILGKAKQLRQAKKISQDHFSALSTSYQKAIEKLEIELGLRPEVKEPAKPSRLQKVRQKIAPPERKPRQSWTWDRVWETLLSERTLEVILFIGVALLFAAGVTWVGFNWGTFPPLVQVSFLVGFTGLFFGLGGYVHNKLNLRGSGVALFGVGSLLIPLDFYAYYLSGGFPPGSEVALWLIGSIICLFVYLLVAVYLQAPFFGYLIGLAAASVALATFNVFNVPLVWWQTAVSTAGFILGSIGFVWLPRRTETRTTFLTLPFQRSGLLFVSVMMLVGLGWRFFTGTPYLITVRPLAISWWLGGCILLLATRHFRLSGMVWATAVSFPVAMWFSQQAILPQTVSAGWYGVGWALLVPLYFVVAKRINDIETDDGTTYGRILLIVAGGITAVSAVWSLSNTASASVVHPLLALMLIFAAYLWRNPRWLWGMGVLLLSGTAAWQGARGATVQEITLPWGLLAIVLIVAALRFEKTAVRYDRPLFGMGWLSALLAVLPPLLLYDRPLLVYGLGSWIGINGWLAMLSQAKTHQGLTDLLNLRRVRRFGETIFHWSAALALVPWLALFLASDTREPSASLGAFYVGLGWLTLGIMVWVRRYDWRNGRPWHVAGQLSNVCALLFSVVPYDEAWFGAVLFGMSLYYFALAKLIRRKNWLMLAGWLGFFGWIWLMNWQFGNLPDAVVAGFISIYILLYTAVSFILAQRWVSADFLLPLFSTALLQGLFLSLYNLGVFEGASRTEYAWLALANLLLGLSLALYAWLYRYRWLAHLSVWFGVGAGGLLVLQFSRGSGRSAALAGLLALALILAERGLKWLALRPYSPLIRHVRYGWRLYRQPLLVAGWLISVGTIGLALFRNLFLLGGGETRQTWSAVALFVVVGLYGLSAYLFNKKRFVYFSAALSFAPWTILTDLGFYIWSRPSSPYFGLSWIILALILLAIAGVMAARLRDSGWAWGAQWVAIGVTAVALLLSIGTENSVAVWTYGLAVLFFATAVYLDHRYYQPAGWLKARFLYPALFLLPVWANMLFDLVVIDETFTQLGLLTLFFSVPALWLGRWVARREPSYQWPLYGLAYGTAVVAMFLVSENQQVLIGVTFFNALLAAGSVWVFKQPLWWFPATVLLPISGALLIDELVGLEARYAGWMLIGIAGLYLLGAYVLSRQKLERYSWPLLVMAAMFGVLGLGPSAETVPGLMIGAGGAALVFGGMAVWRRWPILLFWVSFLIAVSYFSMLWEYAFDWPIEWFSLSVWPLVLAFLATAVFVDYRWGLLPRQSIAPDSQSDIVDRTLRRWFSYLLNWWALPFYSSAFLLVPIASIFSVDGTNGAIQVIGMGMGTAVYAFGTYRFRNKLLFFLAWAWFQWMWMFAIEWANWRETEYFFLPITVLTAVIAILIEKRAFRSIFNWMSGFRWALPLYILLGFDLFVVQSNGLFDFDTWQSVTITAVHGLILAILATLWRRQSVTVGALFLWLIALWQVNAVYRTPLETAVPRYALLALVYGAIGYAWLWRTRQNEALEGHWFGVWKRPLILAGWVLSSFTLLVAFSSGFNVFTLAIRGVLGQFALRPSEVAAANMLIMTFAIVGLFFLIVAFADRRPRWSYVALLLLLGSWTLWLRLIGQQVELQYYAIPVGLYLLGIGWFEWETGQRSMAAWVDYVALFLLFGSAFWQSLTAEVGGVYALLMIIEGLLIVWFGSSRRLRRLLYAGVTAVMLALVGQLIRPLLALNTGVLLLLGAILVGLGILLERKLENVRTMSQDLRQRLESWE